MTKPPPRGTVGSLKGRCPERKVEMATATATKAAPKKAPAKAAPTKNVTPLRSPEVEEAIHTLRPLMENEDNSLWAQGDALKEMNLSDTNYAKVAQYFQRKVITLKTRERVATEFPVHPQPDEIGRDLSVAFGVFETLLRVAPERRRDIFDSFMALPGGQRTIAKLETQISKASGRSLAGVAYKGGMKLGDIKVKGELFADGRLQFTIESAIEAPEYLSHGQRTILTTALL